MNAIIQVTYLYFFFHHPDSKICLSEDRGARCPRNILEPVCVTYQGGDCESPTGFCQKTVINDCLACADGNVAGYIQGECEDIPVQACSSNHLKECEKFSLGSVCGIEYEPPMHSSDAPEIGTVRFDNGCDACGLDAGFYLAGEAHGECMAVSTSTICKPEDTLAKCPTDSGLKACAYYRYGSNGCNEPICRKTVESYCHACLDPEAMFYLNGSCEDNVPIPPEGLQLAAPEVEEVRQRDEPEEIEVLETIGFLL